MSEKLDPEAAAKAAEADLKRLSAQSGNVFTSALARAADHMTAAESDPNDPAELWGRRIGRALSVVGVVVLAFLLGRQLGWW